MNTISKEMIRLPKASLGRLLSAMEFFGSAQDEIEDFLIVRNKLLVAKLKKARAEHTRTEHKDFQILVKKYV